MAVGTSGFVESIHTQQDPRDNKLYDLKKFSAFTGFLQDSYNTAKSVYDANELKEKGRLSIELDTELSRIEGMDERDKARAYDELKNKYVNSTELSEANKLFAAGSIQKQLNDFNVTVAKKLRKADDTFIVKGIAEGVLKDDISISALPDIINAHTTASGEKGTFVADVYKMIEVGQKNNLVNADEETLSTVKKKIDVTNKMLSNFIPSLDIDNTTASDLSKTLGNNTNTLYNQKEKEYLNKYTNVAERALFNLTDTKALAEAREAIEKTKKINEDKGIELENSFNSKYNEAVKQAMVQQGQVNIAQATGDTTNPFTSYTVPLTDKDLQQSFVLSYSNPITRRTKIQEYKDNYNKTESARKYMEQYPIGSARPALLRDNKVLSNFRADVTEIVLTNQLNQGNFSEVIAVTNNEEDLLGTVGENLVRGFYNTEENETLKAKHQQLTMLMKHPKGASTAKKLLGKEFGTIVITPYVAQHLTNGDYAQANVMINEAKAQFMEPTYSPDIDKSLYEKAAQLGSLRDEFIATVNIVGNLDNKKVTPSFLENLRNQFKDNLKLSTAKEADGLKFNTSFSKGPDPIDEEGVEQGIVGMSKHLNYGIAGQEVIFFPNNKMVMTDEYGTPQTLVDLTEMVTTRDKAYEYEKQLEQREKAISTTPRFDVAVEASTTIGATVIDNWVDIAKKMQTLKVYGAKYFIDLFDEE